ncbi:hypothetical protein OBO34_11275 [Clostridiales Family XIII bacterium ASD5510]|uniref:Uncharacterized protein n=1 Tax=Hominibacterium faecale TaxID=2839743 RepID=A0A9J6QP20_9FIRM|nr:hypothetical protein [Hominibacterium faecale]MCU7378937.1 hypothetical protein [Hominibacterium faecale]
MSKTDNKKIIDELLEKCFPEMDLAATEALKQSQEDEDLNHYMTEVQLNSDELLTEAREFWDNINQEINTDINEYLEREETIEVDEIDKEFTVEDLLELAEKAAQKCERIQNDLERALNIIDKCILVINHKEASQRLKAVHAIILYKTLEKNIDDLIFFIGCALLRRRDEGN